jgi:hypothetical protein
MRCVLVNDANLKAEACCTSCRRKIGDRYIREIGSRYLYCDYACYRRGTATTALRYDYLAAPLDAWTLRT